MDFQRPKQQFRFSLGGMKTNTRPDEMPPEKSPLLVNVRAYEGIHMRTRPGIQPLYTIAGQYPTDIQTIQGLPQQGSLVNPTRIFSRGSDDNVYVDGAGAAAGVLVGTLAGAGGTPGAAMIPFRPNQSPGPWMYVANGNDYQKFSCPAAGSTVVTKQKAGIAEPQSEPLTVPALTSAQAGMLPWYESHGNPALTSGGTAGSTSSSARVTDTTGKAFQDPAFVAGGFLSSLPTLWSIQVASTVNYSRFMMLAITIGASTSYVPVMDVFPPLPASINIQSIYYFSGTTGHCVIVPAGLTAEPDANQSIYSPQFLSSLRRGALIKIGTEICFVNSVAFGPDNAIAIDTSTVSTHTTSDKLSGVPAISILGGFSSIPSSSGLSAPSDAFAVTTGLGTVTGAPLFDFLSSGYSYQQDDYIHLSVNIDNLANLVELRFLIDVSDGFFTKDFYYYTIRPADITAAVLNSITQLAAAQQVTQRAAIDEEAAIANNNQLTTFSGAQTATGSSQWTEILFPISALTRVGNDENLSLQNINSFQLLVNASGNVNVILGGVYVFGGYQPDVGDIGRPYLYRYRGLASTTGARSNPSPATRYGITARRMPVAVIIPNGTTPYDGQIDTWEIFRFGGSVSEWRYAGNCPASGAGTNAIFTDNYDDAAVGAGDALDFDNFEPWPSVDLPANPTIVAGAGGTVALLSTTSNPNILSWLPGTIVSFPGVSGNVYTLRKRPVLISGSTYRLEFEECVSSIAGATMEIAEPYVANRMLPYMWGPDATGTVFASGDALRPGTLYFAKNNNPDSAPDSYNIEIVPPSEPLLGGEVIDGLSFVGSPNRWWALYPQPDNPTQRYNFVQTADTRGLAAPYGHCNDGRSRYWWASDGIYSSTQGSLTDADLSTLFPKEGVVGQSYTYGTVTIPPPDYTECSKFRLEYVNGYLYATYVSIGGVYNMLVYDTRRNAWCLDLYQNLIGATGIGAPTTVKGVIQKYNEPGTFVAQPQAKVLMGGVDGSSGGTKIYQQQDLSNDDTKPISGQAGTFEFDGGDVRGPKQWGDLFLDVLPASGITAQPVSLATAVGSALTVAQSATRTRLPYNVNGIQVSDFMGLVVNWTDDYTKIATQTRLYLWQPSFVVQPAREVGFITFGSSFGLVGFMHIRQLLVAYVSTAPVTVQITAYDGQSPALITLPSTGGAYQKATFPVGPNKGTLFQFQLGSTAQFQVFEDDSEVYVGQWGRGDAYNVFRNLGGRPINASPI